jgi:hypothetical protein
LLQDFILNTNTQMRIRQINILGTKEKWKSVCTEDNFQFIVDLKTISSFWTSKISINIWADR